MSVKIQNYCTNMQKLVILVDHFMIQMFITLDYKTGFTLNI